MIRSFSLCALVCVRAFHEAMRNQTDDLYNTTQKGYLYVEINWGLSVVQLTKLKQWSATTAVSLLI